MPSSKDKGNDKGLSKKKAAARRVRTRSISTKSKKQARIEEAQFDTLATVSSPKPKSNSKKLTPPSESTTSSLPTVGDEETPERRRSIVQAVTETKQNIEEEEEESFKSDSSHSSVNQVSITINSSNMTNKRVDAKLEYLLAQYCLAIGNNHEI